MQIPFVSLRVLGVLVVKQKLYHEGRPIRRAGTKDHETGNLLTFGYFLFGHRPLFIVHCSLLLKALGPH